MKTAYKIVRYIFKNNSLIKVPFYLFQGLVYQIFKKTVKKIISVKLFNNKKIFLYPDSNVSSMFAYTDIPDKKEINLLRDSADANTIFLDIGSNIGSYSLLLMDKIKNIYAFEPHPLVVKQCKMNFLLNNYDEKQVVQLALNDISGEVYFTNNQKQNSINKISLDSNNSIKVMSDTLDNFADKYLDKKSDYIVKIDVEGFEYNVLKGGRNFFTNYNVKCIVFECFLNHNSDVFEFLRKLDYKITKIEGDNFYARKIKN